MLFTFLIFLFPPVVDSLPSCLHLRSHCLRDSLCSSYFLSFEKTCGYSLTRCHTHSPSDCVKDLRSIRELLGFSSCVCYRAVGFTEECDYFRQLIWNHPCERVVEDAGQERLLAERDSQVTPLPSPNSRRSTRTPTSDRVHQLVQQLNGDLHTKSRIESGTCNEALAQVCMRHVSCRQLWRLFRSSCGVDQDNKCTMTDPEICWQSFEGLSWTGLGNCHCDTGNPDCHWIRLLTNYNKCIYEISLTKTGTYQQEGDRTAEDYRRRFESSYGDQQRQEAARRQQEQRVQQQQKEQEERERYQQTNHDRSRGYYGQEQSQITEQRRDQQRPDRREQETGGVYQTQETHSGRQDPPYKGADGRIRPDPRIEEESQRNRVWNVQQYHTEATTTSTPSTSTSTTTTTPRPRILVTHKPPPPASTTTAMTFGGSGLRASVMETTEGGGREEDTTFYRPLFHVHSTQRPGYYRYSTVAPDRRTEIAPTRGYERPSTTAFLPAVRTTTPAAPTHPAATRLPTQSPFTRSTCPEAVARCEAADDCRWHLGELRARCSRSSCRREDCASALQRFARYVPPAHAEPVMFCQCSPSDSGCHTLQELFYPPCLYTSASALPTCSQTATRCNSDARCRALRDQLLSSCPLSNGECLGRSLSDCRRVLLAARGSILEQPCFCPLSDVTCMAEQRMMIPSHPCIEKAMRDLPSVLTPQTTALIPRENYHMNEDRMTKQEETDRYQERVKEQHRNKHRGRTTTTTTTSTTTTTTTTNTPAPSPAARGSGRSRHKTTMLPPTTPEPPPPWETTTTELVTTTEEYVTAPPPPAEGCQARDASGRTVFFPMGTVMRRYGDWSSRCSALCECTAVDQLSCELLPCLEDGFCEAPLTTIEFGERIYLKNRGACFCESSQFICELPEEMPELYPGLYMTAGYSQVDIEMLRKEVPSATLEKAGLMSAHPAKDIGSRLQMAFERLQPESLQCRLVLMTELSEPGYAFFRVEWWGMEERFNHTKLQWQHDGSEKVCSPSVTRLADLFSNSDAIRYQLVLSTVKQIKVLDFLDGIPSSSPAVCLLPSLLLFLLLRFV